MYRFNLMTEVFNPRRGMVRVLLQSVYADSAAEAKRTKGVWSKGEKRIAEKV